ncbi:SWIM zinc finger family protein [Thiothrix nivea]|uniref:Zinc finger SWIM domain-containing protein n=1 Tax=Thiothrix nivea (strain ATCC 35100 / DSM 5205 / JP2) TaxID=870187 RepID=A0A656HES2_THINJ|nr:SWIM zinc finger family protein [Thiothrix nivea]EIJ35418.1 zinc finger SWIM domain-containing protein [Thiothrix nivea DSM 5205]
MTTWTTEQVAALAPDAASLKAGEKLSQPHQWQTLGQADGVVWGEIKGSGKNPYQTAIELVEPAFKCSCPSRKFPCKHGIGLALVLAANSDKLTGAEPPSWLQEWLDKRGQRAQKKAEKAAASNEPVDEATLQKRAAAQQKRNAAREDKVSAGIAELQRWLFDLIRQGLSQQDDKQWQRMAARMVDAQAPGLARRLQAIASLRYQGGAWQEKLLAELSRLHLLLEAWQRRDSLPAAVQADVLAHIGFNQPKEEILALDSIADHWQVVGQRQEDDGQIRTQRTWLYGMNSQRFVLLLDFAVQQQPMTLRPPVGQATSGDMVFYPSATPLRALLKDEAAQQPGDTVLAPLFAPLHQCFSRYTEALIANPWLGYFPFAIARVIPVQHDKQWLLVDVAQHCVPLDISDEQAWVLIGESGGHPLNIFGEWDGDSLRICGTFQTGGEA